MLNNKTVFSNANKIKTGDLVYIPANTDIYKASINENVVQKFYEVTTLPAVGLFYSFFNTDEKYWCDWCKVLYKNDICAVWSHDILTMNE